MHNLNRISLKNPNQRKNFDNLTTIKFIEFKGQITSWQTKLNNQFNSSWLKIQIELKLGQNLEKSHNFTRRKFT